MSGAGAALSSTMRGSRPVSPSVGAVPAGVSGGVCASGLLREGRRSGESRVVEDRDGSRLAARESSSFETVYDHCQYLEGI